MQYTQYKHAYLYNMVTIQTNSEYPNLTYYPQAFLLKLCLIALLCMSFLLPMAIQIDNNIGLTAGIALVDNPDTTKYPSNHPLPNQQESSIYQPQTVVSKEPYQLYRAPALFGLLRPPI